MSIIFIEDFFKSEINGGGEQYNHELIKIFKSFVKHIKSADVTEIDLRWHEDPLIVSNFVLLPKCMKDYIIQRGNYVILEHDHKYIKSRNPANYPNFQVPANEIINLDFYKHAQAVFCQTDLQAKIMKQNLKLDNIVNLSGNIWSNEILNLLEQLSTVEKNGKCAIMNSNNWHKNTSGAVEYCKKNALEYVLINNLPSIKFLETLSKFSKLIFFPQTPETCSRIVLEARMMNLGVVLNKLVGAAGEPWFNLKGVDLINKVRNDRQRIADKIMEALII